MKQYLDRAGWRTPARFGILGVTISILAGANAFAASTTFSNGDSTVTLDPSSASGMSSWTVDGANVLNQQSFWFGIDTGAGWNPSSISAIASPVVSSPTVNGATTLSTTYTSPGVVSLQVVYSLLGGSALSGAADLSEQISIQNLSSSPVTFHFYQYADFKNVGSVELTKNSRGYTDAFIQGGGISLNENVDTGITTANHGETLPPGVTLGKLTSGTHNLQLTDNTIGGANNTWAFEWDKTIAAGGTLLISKDLNVAGVTPAPEPGTLSLISIGLIGLGFAKRKFARK
jgi:hypothetical protein